MKTFKEFLIESATGNYVSIDVIGGIVIPVLEKVFPDATVCKPAAQHVTLIYSTGTDASMGNVKQLLKPYFKKITVDIIGVAAFDAVPKEGQRDEDLCTIVVKIHSDVLVEIHERLKAFGLKHSYPEFSPHISILYNFPRSDKKKAIDLIEDWIKENKSTVELSNFNVNPIIDNWSEKK